MNSDRKVPSLLNLCIARQIQHLRRLDDVSAIDDHILERLLPECTVEQLTNIENCTKDRDISQITNNLWKKFFQNEFGVGSADSIIQSMEGQHFKWKEIYEAKIKEREEAAVERLRRGYAEAQKSSHRVKRISYIPPKGHRKKVWWRK